MNRISFANDYSEGADARILEALIQTNAEQTAAYGLDCYSARAREAILARLSGAESDVHFFVGGTQVNLTLIAAALRPHQGAIAAASGHISVHETGAIEATGHKVLTLPSENGKLAAAAVDAYIAAHFADENHEHTPQPGLVYLSQPTEFGTLYSKAELTALSDVCKKWDIPLYIDGARLGCALTARTNDVFLPDLARLTSAFTIGGTKMGALFGEALVLNDARLKKDFRYIQKRHGAFLAKGRLLGVQFLTLFSGTLYEELAAHANAMAQKLARGLESRGCALFMPTQTNQVFAVLPRARIERLEERYSLSFWQPYDETQDVVRLCCSFATEETTVDAFLTYLETI